MRNLPEYLTTCPISANSGLNQNFQIWAVERFCETLCTIQSLEVCNIVVQLDIAIKIKLHLRQTFYAVFTYKIWLMQRFDSSAKKSNAWQPGWRLPSSENCLTGQHMSQASMYLNCHRRAEFVKSDLVSTWLDQCFFHNLFHQRGILYIHMCETTKGPQSL